MYLAVSLRDHPNEVRADLQRFFGLNMDNMGVDFTLLHAAVCISHLPYGSALVARYQPNTQITIGTMPIKPLIDALAHKDESDNPLANAVSMPMDEFMQEINKEWKDVDDGNSGQSLPITYT